MEGYICMGLIPEEFKDKWSIHNCYPNFNLNGLVDKDVKYTRRSKGEWSPNGLRKGDILSIYIDMDKRTFKVKDQSSKEISELQIIPTKYKAFRIYIIDLDGKNNQFTLMKSGRV